MTALTTHERRRLASILGMLGSNSAGERDNAARMAEDFRRQHKLTWNELLGLIAVPEVTPEAPPPVPPEPEVKPASKAPPTPHYMTRKSGFQRVLDRTHTDVFVYGFAAVFIAVWVIASR